MDNLPNESGSKRKPVWLFDQDGCALCSLENGQLISIERRRTVLHNAKSEVLSSDTAVTLMWVLYLEDISSENKVSLGRYTNESDALNALNSVASCLIDAGNFVFRLTDNSEGK